MTGDQSVRDPLLEHFSSIEEAAEFWDTHSSADYAEYFLEAHFDVDLQGRTQEVRVKDGLVREVSQSHGSH